MLNGKVLIAGGLALDSNKVLLTPSTSCIFIYSFRAIVALLLANLPPCAHKQGVHVGVLGLILLPPLYSMSTGNYFILTGYSSSYYRGASNSARPCILGDDGYKNKSGFNFCTHSFTREEVELLCSAFNDKFNLESSIQLNHGKPMVYIRAPVPYGTAEVLRLPPAISASQPVRRPVATGGGFTPVARAGFLDG
jgi:hypothetical protein